MEYLRGYRVFRDDPSWGSKLLVASLMLLSTACIPFIGQLVVAGWQADIMRRAHYGHAGLPRLDFDFNHLMEMLMRGAKLFVVQLVWQLPAILIGGGLGVALYVGVIAAVVAGGAGDGDSGLLVACAVIGFGLMLIPLIVLLILPSMVAVIRTALTDDMSAGLAVGEVLEMTKAMWRELLVGLFVVGVVAVPIVMLGMLACYIGVFPAIAIMTIAQAHLLVQVYEAWLGKGGAPLQVLPPSEASGALAP